MERVLSVKLESKDLVLALGVMNFYEMLSRVVLEMIEAVLETEEQIWEESKESLL